MVKAILSTVLGDRSPSRYAFLDCVECHTPRLIFEHAIFQFRNAPKQLSATFLNRNAQRSSHSQPTGTQPKQSRGGDKGSRKRRRNVVDQDLLWDKCENVNEFVEWCRKVCDEDPPQDVDRSKGIGTQDPQGIQQETRFLVLDRAERLRDSAPDLIPVLMRLQELVRRTLGWHMLLVQSAGSYT